MLAFLDLTVHNVQKHSLFDTDLGPVYMEVGDPR